jgi:hypothetical protein
MKERAPEVLYGEYEPCLRAMGEKGRQGEVEEEEKRSRREKGRGGYWECIWYP